VALHGRERRIDAGELGGRLFFNVAGVGVDAWIAHRFNTGQPGERRGLLRYLSLAARAGLEYSPRALAVSVNGDPVEAARPYLLTIANSRQFGNRARVAPHARMDDGQLDLVVVQGRSAGQASWRLRGLLGRGLEPGAGVSFTPASEVRIDSDAPIDFHVDGEPVHGGSSLVARVHPGALTVRC
jgi:diacylglycerol kinase family enzyme